MSEKLGPVDVSGVPALLHLAEEVRASGVSRLLKRGSAELAIRALDARRRY